MEPWLVGFGLLVSLGAVVVTVRARRMGDRVGEIAGASPGNDPVRAVATLRARQEQLEADVAAARLDHELLIEAFAQGVLAVDSGMRIVAANSAAHAFLARPPGGLVGRTVIEAFLDVQAEQVARSAIEQGSAGGELGGTDADGLRLLVRARRASGGGAWLILEDVSELRRLQQIRTEFIDNLSHELRTPLTTVSLLAETLNREADQVGSAIPAKMRDRIGKIEVEIGHLVQMVGELLDLSRIESGGTIRMVDRVDLGRIAIESTERVRLFADRQRVALRVDAAAGLPPVRGDAARLGQVFVNLLHNAVKFSPDGGDVTVGVMVHEGSVVGSVADHGIGIPQAAQARIFERFYKVDRARARGEAGGTGLGLAIARHIVEQHGGTIWVESTEGSGSNFQFALPIADASA